MFIVSFVSRPTLLIINRSSLLFRGQVEYPYPCYVWRKKAKRDSPETMTIVAEYAKSNRSSCKSCSKTIAAKTLRLGLISKGPGGIDMPRWHHFDCFPTDSESIVSVHDIEGFSALQTDDQDTLAKLVEQCGEPSKELGEKEEEIENPALDEISGPKVKETTASSKVIAEYAKSSRSSCKKCSQPIASKQLRLGLVTRDSRGFDMTKWHHMGCFPVDSDPIDTVENIGGFSSLQKDDQDTLAKFVEQCGEPAKELDEKEEEIKMPAFNERSKAKVKEMTASSKVISEYAKSSRSSCKKCSQPIASKQLRLGLVTRDSRGFDMTKWHHLGCFPVDSDPIDTVEDIGGFSSLQNDDQDLLKGLVQKCGKNTFVDNMDENNAEYGTDNPLTEDTNKRKHSQVGEMVEEEGSQRNANKQATRNPMMNISESSSQDEVTEEISLSASDVKAKYRDASLLPRWKAFETVIFLERDDGLNDSEKIAAFDFDGCLAKTSVKTVGADAWSLMYSSIPEKLQSLYSQGYKLVIFTNESNIDRWKNKRQAAVDSKIGRLNSFIKRVEVPIQVFIACGVASSGGKDDLYRKPQAGMWQLMKKHFNSGIAIDMDKSFYVGDAAGRKGDHSDADIKFAQASGLKFYTPEEYFIS